MKFKYGLIALALGFCMDFFGAWMKITHWPNADGILLFATVLKTLSIIFLVVKLVSHPKLKDFMNN